MDKRVLLLDGSQKSTLAVLRSLAKKGVKCYVGEYFTPNICTFSKYCSNKVQYPSPYLKIDKFKNFIYRYVQENKLDAIFPMTDTTIPLVLDLLKKTKYYHLISHIDREKYYKASDKRLLLKLAQLLSVPYPKSKEVNEEKDILELSDQLDYPVVIKPGKSITYLDNKAVPLKVSYAKNSKELIDILKIGLKYKYNYLVQQFIHGEGIGFFCLYRKGKLITKFYHRRILEKPPSGGVSVLCESIKEDLKVRKYATKILDELKWHGVAMVEFKKEYETGIPYLMEINARFWGSLELAVRCGVDFPYETYKMICKNHLGPENNDYEIGIRCSWITGILDHIFILLKEKKIIEMLSSIKTIFNTRKKTHDFILSKNDFLPFFYEMYKNIKNAL